MSALAAVCDGPLEPQVEGFPHPVGGPHPVDEIERVELMTEAT